VSEPGEGESERKKTILRAAIDVFAQKGYHGCRISDVAKEAGVAYGLVYHYFKNKEQLLQSVFESGWGGFVNRVRDVVARESAVDEKIAGVVRVAFEAYRIDPGGVKVLILEIARNPSGDAVNRASAFTDVLQLSASVFAQGQAEGSIRPELNPILCSALLFGAVEMALTGIILGVIDAKDDAALEDVESPLVDSFLRGVLTAKALAAAEGRVRPGFRRAT
jgi:TetR/AcrR family fatty acid metabolism transcriptional regulator